MLHHMKPKPAGRKRLSLTKRTKAFVSMPNTGTIALNSQASKKPMSPLQCNVPQNLAKSPKKNCTLYPQSIKAENAGIISADTKIKLDTNNHTVVSQAKQQKQKLLVLSKCLAQSSLFATPGIKITMHQMRKLVDKAGSCKKLALRCKELLATFGPLHCKGVSDLEEALEQINQNTESGQDLVELKICIANLELLPDGSPALTRQQLGSLLGVVNNSCHDAKQFMEELIGCKESRCYFRDFDALFASFYRYSRQRQEMMQP